MSSVIAALAPTPVNDGLLGGAMGPFDSEFVLSMVAYLASDAAAYVNGQALNVCGGIEMH